MSVDFFVCKNCGETFPECGEYYTCMECEKYLCDGCGRQAIEEFGMIEKEWCGEGPNGCQVCKGDTITPEAVALHVCKKFGVGYGEMVAEVLALRKIK